MTYIIENANILKDQKLTKSSLLIENGKISSIKPIFKKYRHMRMDADPYIMTPSPILFTKEIPGDLSFQEIKKYYIQEYILKGSTAFLTMATVKHEYEVHVEIKKLKIRLLNCPVDYIIGVRCPIRLITQSFMRRCKREKVPAVFVDIQCVDELYEIPWGWIREAMFPYNSPLIPMFINNKEKENKQAKVEWKRIMEEEKIPCVPDELVENQPISYPVRSQIGIFPLKSSIHQGCELSYNLYLKSNEIRKIDEEELFHNHRNKLVITVHKGEVIRVKDEVIFRPGFGEHVKINTPSFYKIDV
ncbi:hypothetical protein KHA94_12635 [Bacillus sp. FJAT-49705]|uniref:Uncharacterized protein n=1 Tax=Cytobacillus citreus TaxID=2833586 RepID=A0ABS5NV81_9BACI|nr:hypothetical protein [Cytobacillus citreus]MBS4191028.1 hypothetical protein [Cytobacillus citreus]